MLAILLAEAFVVTGLPGEGRAAFSAALGVGAARAEVAYGVAPGAAFALGARYHGADGGASNGASCAEGDPRALAGGYAAIALGATAGAFAFTARVAPGVAWDAGVSRVGAVPQFGACPAVVGDPVSRVAGPYLEVPVVLAISLGSDRWRGELAVLAGWATPANDWFDRDVRHDVGGALSVAWGRTADSTLRVARSLRLGVARRDERRLVPRRGAGRHVPLIRAGASRRRRSPRRARSRPRAMAAPRARCLPA